MELLYEGICYVLLRTNVFHPIAHRRFDLIWYPETGLRLLDQVAYRPYIQSIVTESAWLIGCYDREDVRVWRDGDWRCPNHQTYGASVSEITSHILGIRQTISSTPLDGGKEISKFKEELEASYEAAKCQTTKTV